MSKRTTPLQQGDELRASAVLACAETAGGEWRGFCVHCRRWHIHSPGPAWRNSHCGITPRYLTVLDSDSALRRSDFTRWLRESDYLPGGLGDLVLRAALDPQWPSRRRTLRGFTDALTATGSTAAELAVLPLAWRCWWLGGTPDEISRVTLPASQ